MGPTCNCIDVVVNDCLLPKLEIGDWIVFPDVGAYTVVSASYFGGMTKPKCYYILPEQYWSVGVQWYNYVILVIQLTILHVALHQFFANCTGFQCGSVSTSLCLGTLPATWLTTVALWPTFAQEDCARHRSLFDSRTRTNFGDRAFTAAGPQVLNILPTDLTQPDLS